MRAAVSASASTPEGHLEVESDERAGHQEQEPLSLEPTARQGLSSILSTDLQLDKDDASPINISVGCLALSHHILCTCILS